MGSGKQSGANTRKPIWLILFAAGRFYNSFDPCSCLEQ